MAIDPNLIVTPDVITPVDFQPDQISGFGYALQTVKGTQAAAPTDQVVPTTFGTPYDPQTMVVRGLSGSLEDAVSTVPGFPLVGGTLSSAFWLNGLGLMLRGLFQTDILTGASPVSFGTVATTAIVVGATTMTLSATVPSPPAGREWTGTYVTVGAGAGAETIGIESATGTTVNVIGSFQKAHSIGDAVSVPVQHQLAANTSRSTVALFPYFSIWAQYAAMFERQLKDCKITQGTLTASTDQFAWAINFGSDSDIVAETSSLTTLVAGTGEGAGADTVIAQSQGALYTKIAAADTRVTAHGGLFDLNFAINLNDKPQKAGGLSGNVQPHILTSRTLSLAFKALAGPLGAVPTIRNDFVKNQQNRTPAFLVYQNGTLGFILWFPNCSFFKYDPADPGGNAVSYDGTLQPYPDVTSSKSVKLTILNQQVSAAY